VGGDLAAPWQPEPQPVVVELGTDAGENPDFIDSYKSKGETYTLTLTYPYGSQHMNVFDLLDWKGSTVTLRGEEALPVGVWEDESPGSTMIWELDLER